MFTCHNVPTAPCPVHYINQMFIKLFITGQTAPRQPAQVPMEVQIVHKQELPEIEDEDEEVSEVIISGL